KILSCVIDPVASFDTFRGLRLGCNHRTVVARLVRLWFQVRRGNMRRKRTMHMLWLDKKDQLLEGMVE
ncbi:unnamed protein product, partial [Linum tenue]